MMLACLNGHSRRNRPNRRIYVESVETLMHWCAKFGLSDRCQHSLGETAAVPYSYKVANLRSRDVTYTSSSL